MAAAPAAHGAALSNDARTAIPRDVQQIIMVDYRAMQNSPAALSLKDRIMPPELKRLEQALISSGLKVESDTDALAFTSFRAPSPDGKGGQVERIVGIAQGQFRTRDILANLAKSKAKFDKRRNNNIYPMGASGFEVSFVNPTTMVFGDRDAIYAALDARDGKLLWKASVGGAVRSGPMTYMVSGRQYVAVDAGNSLFVWALRQ